MGDVFSSVCIFTYTVTSLGRSLAQTSLEGGITKLFLEKNMPYFLADVPLVSW
jgi:hypothetical protein